MWRVEESMHAEHQPPLRFPWLLCAKHMNQIIILGNSTVHKEIRPKEALTKKQCLISTKQFTSLLLSPDKHPLQQPLVIPNYLGQLQVSTGNVSYRLYIILTSHWIQYHRIQLTKQSTACELTPLNVVHKNNTSHTLTQGVSGGWWDRWGGVDRMRTQWRAGRLCLCPPQTGCCASLSVWTLVGNHFPGESVPSPPLSGLVDEQWLMSLGGGVRVRMTIMLIMVLYYFGYHEHYAESLIVCRWAMFVL